MAGVWLGGFGWRYSDASGKLLKQFVEQEADFVVTPVTGADGAMRPDPVDAMNRIANSFPTPPGASIPALRNQFVTVFGDLSVRRHRAKNRRFHFPSRD